jgi:hypothetical protein
MGSGIDFGHKHISVALADGSGAEIGSAMTLLNVDINAQEAMNAACELLDRLCKNTKSAILSRLSRVSRAPWTRNAEWSDPHGFVGLGRA